MAWMRLTARGRAGHGSMINRENAVTELAGAVARIGAHQWPVRLTPTMQTLLAAVADLAGTEATPENAEALVEEFGGAARMLGAVIRNTANPTMLEAGYKVNVIPTEATAHVDGRFLPGYEDEFFATLAELCGEHVSIDFLSRQQPWETPYDGELVDAMSRSILAEDPDAVVAPYSMSGGTDAKHFNKLGMRSYGFAPLRLPADLDFTALFHGVDERVPVDALEFGARVFDRFLDRASEAGQPGDGTGRAGSAARWRMILRRRTTRRVPSAAIAHAGELPAAVLGALDEHPGHDVAGELARAGSAARTPTPHRGEAVGRSGACGQSVSRHVVERRRRSRRAGSARRRRGRRAAARRSGRRRSGR